MAIFSLNEVRTEQIKNIANDNFESWPESATYGYFGGGFAPPSTPSFYKDTIDRIDFSNETVSAPGENLSQGRSDLAAVSSSSYGYFGGGFAPPYVDTIDRIDFSNETTSAPGNNLPQPRGSLAALSSNSYGYFGGGQSPAESPPYVNTIDRIDFSNETTSPVTATLSQARRRLAAVSNSSYGYFGGGFTPPQVTTIDRIDFSNETTSAPGDNLPQARSRLAAVSSSSYGYFGAGQNPAESSPIVNTIDRIDFSNGTTSAPSNNLPQARGGLAAVSSSSYGYFGGGFDPPTAPTVNTIDRIDFSNETTSAPGENLPQARYSLAAVSGGASQRIKGSRTYGYFAGGGFPTVLNTIERIDFSNESISSPGNNLSQVRYSLEGTSSSSYGYFGGGRNPGLSPSYLDTIDRIDFSNETLSAPGNNLPQARLSLAAVSSSSYGYFGCGSAPSRVATIDRIDFVNETTSAPGNNLTQARTALAACSSSSYGYFGGGSAPPRVTTVDRIDFSNETTSAPGNNLSQARLGLAAVSSSSYGYFGGGYAPPYATTVDRIDFSSETLSAPGNNLSQARSNLAAVSSSSYGYFGGGAAGSPPSPSSFNTDTIDRLDFSNETTSAPGNDLSQGRYGPAALSN